MKLDKLIKALSDAGISRDDIEVKSINESDRFYTVESNGCYLGVWDEPEAENPNYCPRCGQALDWSD